MHYYLVIFLFLYRAAAAKQLWSEQQEDEVARLHEMYEDLVAKDQVPEGQ